MPNPYFRPYQKTTQQDLGDELGRLRDKFHGLLEIRIVRDYPPSDTPALYLLVDMDEMSRVLSFAERAIAQSVYRLNTLDLCVRLKPGSHAVVLNVVKSMVALGGHATDAQVENFAARLFPYIDERAGSPSNLKTVEPLYVWPTTLATTRAP